MAKEVGDYILLREVGKGAFSVVYESKHKETGEIYAVKVIDTSKSDPAKLQREIDILKMVDHPYVIKLYDVFDGNDGKLYIVTDFVLI